jgi:hypothetical protein
LVEAALLLDIVVLLVLVRTYIPIPGFQGVLRLVCPAPFVLLALRRGARTCVVAAVSAYILLSTLIGPVLAIQILVFGGLGALFGAFARRRRPPALAIVLGAAGYGVFYLFLPVLLGLWLLRISPKSALDAVATQMHNLAAFLASFRIGTLALHDTPLFALSQAANWLATHAVQAYVVTNVLYSLVNIWAYFLVTQELFRILPQDVRTDAQGATVDFYT